MGFLSARSKEGAATVWGSGACRDSWGGTIWLGPLCQNPPPHHAAPNILRIPGPGLSESHEVFQLPEVNFLISLQAVFSPIAEIRSA